MPLVRIDLQKGKSAAYTKAISGPINDLCLNSQPALFQCAILSRYANGNFMHYANIRNRVNCSTDYLITTSLG
jgi:hypothetical protein